MFTGLAERVGRVERITPGASEALLRIACGDLSRQLRKGESVSVDGVCLTVVRLGDDWFETDVSSETLRRTTLSEKGAGSRVNLERALKAGDRLGGHLVQGHVDGVGALVRVVQEGMGRRISVAPPRGLERYLAEKGSVALDGISLTVASLGPQTFEVAVIPHTLEATTLGEWQSPRRINLEVDLVSRYLERLLEAREGADRISRSEMTQSEKG